MLQCQWMWCFSFKCCFNLFSIGLNECSPRLWRTTGSFNFAANFNWNLKIINFKSSGHKSFVVPILHSSIPKILVFRFTLLVNIFSNYSNSYRKYRWRLSISINFLHWKKGAIRNLKRALRIISWFQGYFHGICTTLSTSISESHETFRICRP